MQITIPNIEGSGKLYLDIMNIISGPRKDFRTLCDIMCHRCPYNWQLDFTFFHLVDIQYRGLDIPSGLYFEFIREDVFEFLNCHNDFDYFEDTIVCSDGIEHLKKEQGLKLIVEMERHSRNQIIFTPLGELSVSDDSKPDSHKSGWYPEDFNGWDAIVFPNFHPQLNCGAFFAYNCTPEEKQRIINEIKQKYVCEDQTN